MLINYVRPVAPRFFVWMSLLSTVGLYGDGASAETQTASTRHLIWGVFPHVATTQIEEMFSPMAADFSRVLGRSVQLKTKPTFELFAGELEKESYDIAFVQPFDYVWAHDKYGYEPLAHRGEPLSALFVVKEGSAIRNLQDLHGKRIGFPPETAAVSQLAKLELLRANFRPGKDVNLLYFKGHDACLHQLVVGDIDVCGSAAYPVRLIESQWNVKFRTVAQTQSIPHAVFIAHPRISKKERELIRKTIISWADTEAGRKLLEQSQLKPFVVATDTEYDVVRNYLRKK